MSLWGPLAERYEVVRPRKLLAPYGGGIRGMLTLEILAERERQLAEVTASDDTFRLYDFFDYIGGTSTGAIISTDSVQHLDDLSRVGQSVAKGVRVQDCGPFVTRWDRTRP